VGRTSETVSAGEEDRIGAVGLTDQTTSTLRPQPLRGEPRRLASGLHEITDQIGAAAAIVLDILSSPVVSDKTRGVGAMALSMLGWLGLGIFSGRMANEVIPTEHQVDPASLVILGAIGAWIGGVVAYACRFGLEPDDPGHWILAIVGAIVLLTLRFLGTKPRTIF
jgi:uncharacterized membrane protein YeaQ/YmgE (transglycosylase-associated protein family)